MARVKFERRKNKHTLKSVSEAESLRFESKIAHKKHLLSNALKIPPAVFQFKTHLSENDQKSLFDILENYKPETREQRQERIKKYIENGNQHEGPKPFIIKFGMKHVVDLIEQKIAKLVVIAADVDPLEIVLYLPTLCKKLQIPYCIVQSKSELGAMVRLNQTACICVTGWNSQHEAQMADLLSSINSQFIDRYEQTMNTWGGGVVLSRAAESETQSISNNAE